MDNNDTVTMLQQASELAQRVAREAGEQALRMSASRVIDYKGVVDLVTDADRANEVLISSAIREAFPQHRLKGEEGAVGSSESPWRWLIDPIDGTTNYAHAYPQWAVSICLERDGDPHLGVVYDASKDEMFFAIKGQGATLNGRPIHVSDIREPIRALCATGFSYDPDGREPAMLLWHDMHRFVQGLRRDGAAALDMTWVACGRLDAYWENPINNHDVGAGVVIAREAGALVSNFDGSPYQLDGNQILCTNGYLHDAIVQLLTTVG